MTKPTAAAQKRTGGGGGGGGSGQRTWTLEEHIDHLQALLRTPAAEELHATWVGYATLPQSADGAEMTAQPADRSLALGLKDYKAALDSGRRISSQGEPASSVLLPSDGGEEGVDTGGRMRRRRQHVGLPLTLVVRMLKAAWHVEGSWPLVGSDAPPRTSTRTPHLSTSNSTSTSKDDDGRAGAPPMMAMATKSIHPSAVLIKRDTSLANGASTTPLVPPGPGGPAIQLDPSPEEVAAAYRRRGVHVDDAPLARGEGASDDEGGGGGVGALPASPPRPAGPVPTLTHATDE